MVNVLRASVAKDWAKLEMVKKTSLDILCVVSPLGGNVHDDICLTSCTNLHLGSGGKVHAQKCIFEVFLTLKTEILLTNYLKMQKTG